MVMMNNLRTSSSSFALKIFLVIIVLSFLLPSINGFFIKTDEFDYIAKVNGQKISQSQFKNALIEERNFIEEQFSSQNQKFISNKQNAKIQNQRILNRLINETLLNQYAKKLGIKISDELVKREIFSTPSFQSNGQFDIIRYNSVIDKMKITSDQYNQIIRQKLIIQLLINTILKSDFLLKGEVDRLLPLITQIRFVREANVDIKPFLMPKQQVSDIEIENYYEKYKNFFIDPERFRVSYIKLDISAIQKDSLNIKDTEIQSFYKQHCEQFRIPPRGCYSIIQTKTKKDAQIVLRKLNSGENFSFVAKRMSVDILSRRNGGNIGWIDDRILPEEFKNIRLKKGEFSDIVQSSVGYLIIYLNDIELSRLKSLSEVRKEIIEKIKKEKAESAYSLLREKVKNVATKNTKSLTCIEQITGIRAIKTNWFNRENFPKELNFKPVIDTIFNDGLIDKDGFSYKNSGIITIDNNLAFILRITEHNPEMLKPLTEVRNQIISQILLNKAMKKAELDLEKLINEIMKSGKEEKSVMKMIGLTFNKKRTLIRLNSEYDPIIRRAFSLPLPRNGKSSYGFTNDIHGNLVLLALDRVESVRISNEQKNLIIQSIIQNNAQVFAESLMTTLRKKAKIEIYSIPNQNDYT